MMYIQIDLLSLESYKDFLYEEMTLVNKIEDLLNRYYSECLESGLDDTKFYLQRIQKIQDERRRIAKRLDLLTLTCDKFRETVNYMKTVTYEAKQYLREER